MQYPIFFFAILTFISGSTDTNKQTDSKPLADSITCQNGLMQKAWYSYGVDSTLQPLSDQRKEFIIWVDETCKATNFISHVEHAARTLPYKDTGFLRYLYPSTWDALAVNEKFKLLDKENKNRLQRADAEHTENNNGKHVIRIKNNTSDTVFLQVQAGSIMTVMEGVMKNGQWGALQYWQFNKCGNSYYNTYFLPNTTGGFVAHLPNQGNYETKLRFKLMGKNNFYYSNEFTGKIDYCEFTTPTAYSYYKLDTLIRASNFDMVFPM